MHQVRVCACECRGASASNCEYLSRYWCHSFPAGKEERKRIGRKALAAPTLCIGYAERARVQACYPNRRMRTTPAGSESLAGRIACACISSSGALQIRRGEEPRERVNSCARGNSGRVGFIFARKTPCHKWRTQRGAAFESEKSVHVNNISA